MAAVAAQDLEGIVAKRKRDPYRQGVRWWKIKNAAYSQAEGRHERFNGPRRPRTAADASGKKKAPLTLLARRGLGGGVPT